MWLCGIVSDYTTHLTAPSEQTHSHALSVCTLTQSDPGLWLYDTVILFRAK